MKNKLPDISEKFSILKQESLKCTEISDYDGAYNVFTKMNNLFPPKYRVKLERFKTGDE